MVEAKQWLESQEKYNTKEKRGAIKELDIKEKELEGKLDLSDFVNLEKLDCSHNQLNGLNLRENIKLEFLNCSNNQIIRLNLINCKELMYLYCSSNKITELDVRDNHLLHRVDFHDNKFTTFVSGFNPLLDHILTGNPSILDLSKHRKPNYSDDEDPLTSLTNSYKKRVREIEKRRQQRVKWDKSTQTDEFEESWKRIWVADLCVREKIPNFLDEAEQVNASYTQEQLKKIEENARIARKWFDHRYITRLDAENSLKVYRNGWSPEDIIDGMATLAIAERKIQIELESKKEDAKAIRDKLEIVNGIREELEETKWKLKKQERKVEKLNELLGKTKEEIIDYKIKAKEGKLEILIQKLGIDRTVVRELRKFYQQWIQISVDCNQDEIDVVDDKIGTIKDELLERGVSMNNVQKLCKRCEKLANLKLEQDNLYKERFEARQEVSTR